MPDRGGAAHGKVDAVRPVGLGVAIGRHEGQGLGLGHKVKDDAAVRVSIGWVVEEGDSVRGV